MALAITRENFFWHKLHSLTGVVPVGYYMVQHLVLNAFSLAGPDKFNGVIDFFEGIPWYVLLTMEIFFIWLPILFHGLYGLVIVDHAKPNYFGTKYGWSQNRMFTLQRYSGIFIFAFLIYHFIENTGVKYATHNSDAVKFEAWHQQLTSHAYLWLVFYMAGVLAASYHLGYGLWNFCIRWGITVSEAAQMRIQKASAIVFILLTLLGWAALAGFLIPRPDDTVSGPVSVMNEPSRQGSLPARIQPQTNGPLT